MKKHILVLLFLLLALIVVCVYQKTYTIYAKAHADDNTTVEVPELPKQVQSDTKEIESINMPQGIVHKPFFTKSEPTPKEATKELPTVAQDQDEQKTINTTEEEQEVIAYLLSVLEERAEAEAKLHALIKRVLKDRKIAVEDMHKISKIIEEEQQKRLDYRDSQTYEYIEKEGNK